MPPNCSSINVKKISLLIHLSFLPLFGFVIVATEDDRNIKSALNGLQHLIFKGVTVNNKIIVVMQIPLRVTVWFPSSYSHISSFICCQIYYEKQRMQEISLSLLALT